MKRTVTIRCRLSRPLTFAFEIACPVHLDALDSATSCIAFVCYGCTVAVAVVVAFAVAVVVAVVFLECRSCRRCRRRRRLVVKMAAVATSIPGYSFTHFPQRSRRLATTKTLV